MRPINLDETRLAIRRLVKRPAVSLASIVTLACGIGAGAATYSLISSVLLQPLPVAEADRLVEVDARYTDRSGVISSRLETGQLYTTFTGIRDSGAFSVVAAGGRQTKLVTEHGQAQQRVLYFASHNFFEALGVRLMIGPGFRSEDDRRGAGLRAIVSHRYWQRVLGADPGIVGKTLIIANKPAIVVGVAPARFRGLNLAEAPDVYLPLHTIGEVGDPLSNYFAEPVGRSMSSPSAWLTVIARLKAEAASEDSLTQLNALGPEIKAGRTFILTPINTAAIPEAGRAGMTKFASLLSVTVGLLLLIAGLTVGMLLLIRTEARRDEFAMCLALGATRRRLAGGVAIEGALLSLAGAVAAIPIAWALSSGLGAFQLPGRVDIERLDLHLDLSAVLGTAAGAIAVTSLIAIVAGVFGFTANLADVLRARPGSAPNLARRRTRSLLVAAQIAVTFVLLAGAGLFARSLITALELNPGFAPQMLATGTVSLAPYGYTAPRATAFFDDLRERLSHNPSIKSVALMRQRGGMGAGGTITIDGQPRQFPSMVAYIAVDDRYFTTMGMRILAGRDFSPNDTVASPLVIIVSESFGRMLALGGDPLEHQVTETTRRVDQPFAVAEVVGVVPDVVTNVAVLEPLAVYYALTQQGASTSGTVILRAASDPTAAAREARNAIREIDPAVNAPPMLTLQEQIGRQMEPQRFGALVLGVLASIAILLTILGAYVLAESMAAVRRREMGIRAALGASRIALGGLLLWQTGRLVGVGLLIGLTLAWFGASTIRAFLFQVQPLDPTTLITVSATILSLALAVSLRPAVAATRLDLAQLLREE